jgi:hypothetical protein
MYRNDNALPDRVVENSIINALKGAKDRNNGRKKRAPKHASTSSPSEKVVSAKKSNRSGGSQFVKPRRLRIEFSSDDNSAVNDE